MEDLLGDYNICIAVKEKLVKDSGVADETAYDIIVQKLLTKPRARGKFTFLSTTLSKVFQTDIFNCATKNSGAKLQITMYYHNIRYEREVEFFFKNTEFYLTCRYRTTVSPPQSL